MKSWLISHAKTVRIAGIVFALLLIGAVGYVLYRANAAYKREIADLQNTVSGLEANLAASKDEGVKLAEALQSEQDKNANLTQTLQSEQTKNAAFGAQLRDISGTVGSLQKLSNTDPELLQKYSKVYFLSENYVPAQVVPVDAQYAEDKSKLIQIATGVRPYLESMLAAAAQTSSTIRIVSAYRSFAEQAAVKTGYKFLYGTGANQFSADQGYSEHQLGTAVDLTTPEIATLSTSFEKSSAGKWMTENAYKFGFTLSYPKSNTYYQFEPWHWRFVGVALATKLHNENKYFYELTQREIDPFLISIFD